MTLYMYNKPCSNLHCKITIDYSVVWPTALCWRAMKACEYSLHVDCCLQDGGFTYTQHIHNMDVLGVSKAYYVHYVPHITWDKLKQTNQNADNRIKAISVLRQCALWSMRVTRALPPILHPLRYDRDTGSEGWRHRILRHTVIQSHFQHYWTLTSWTTYSRTHHGFHEPLESNRWQSDGDYMHENLDNQILIMAHCCVG